MEALLAGVSLMALFIMIVRGTVDFIHSEPDLIIKDDDVYYDIDEKRKYI